MTSSTVKKRFLRAVSMASMAAFLVSCGSDDLFKLEDERKSEGQSTPDPSRTANVPLSVSSDTRGFALAAPTTDDFVIAISGCSSGYTTTVTSTSESPVSSVSLYTGDGNCLAGLSSFTWNAVTYSVGSPLTSGAALFTDGGTNELYVTVGTQLDATLTGSSRAVFLVSEIMVGSDYAISGYSVQPPLSVEAIEAPELEIPAGGVTLASIDGVSGVATFTVNVQCVNTLSGDPATCQTPGSANQAFADMTASLVTDVYGGTLDYADANTIAGAGATVIAAPDLSVAAPITTQGFTVNLTGEGALFTNRNMILVIEYTDPTSGGRGKSYRYFNVDIGLPQPL